MEKSKDVYDRWEQGHLSQAEAAEILGRSERTFRRYIDRFEARGLAGLRDGRLGSVSEKALPADATDRILSLYRRCHMGWNVTHFHEHVVRHHGCRLGYTCLKNRLQDAGLVRVARAKGGHRRKRERRPMAGMMLHQDASRGVWLAGRPALDLVVTMDDATSEIYSALALRGAAGAARERLLAGRSRAPGRDAVHRGDAHCRPRQHDRVGGPASADPREPTAPALRQSRRHGARLSRRPARL
ncbi:MAG: helix-turn-helix domain-containing protein [Hyphomicrobiaceae bacterium]